MHALSFLFIIAQRNSPYGLTPEISPRLNAPNIMMTPLILSQTENAVAVLDIEDDILQQFSLEGEYVPKSSQKHKRIKKQSYRPRLNSLLYYADNELEQIIEETKQKNEDQDSEIHSSQQQQFYDDIIESELQISGSIQEQPFFEQQKQSTTQYMLINQPISHQWMVPNPKKQIFGKLKSILESNEIGSEEAKVDSLKETVKSYALQSQKFYINQCMENLQGNIQQVFATLCKGIQQTLRKNIGGLPFEKRRVKLLKYMEKKNRRIWRKKVNYDCRKKVADGRLRVKGKFVTYKQACQQLGIPNSQKPSSKSLRELLEQPRVSIQN